MEEDWTVVDPMDEAIPRLVDVDIDGQSCGDGNRSRLAQGLPVVQFDQIDISDGGVEAVVRMGSQGRKHILMVLALVRYTLGSDLQPDPLELLIVHALVDRENYTGMDNVEGGNMSA